MWLYGSSKFFVNAVVKAPWKILLTHYVLTGYNHHKNGINHPKNEPSWILRQLFVCLRVPNNRYQSYLLISTCIPLFTVECISQRMLNLVGHSFNAALYKLPHSFDWSVVFFIFSIFIAHTTCLPVVEKWKWDCAIPFLCLITCLFFYYVNPKLVAAILL